MISDNGTSKSIRQKMKPLFHILVPVLICSILLNILSISLIRREQNNYAGMILKAYVKTADSEINALARSEAKLLIDYGDGKGPLVQALPQILYGEDAITRSQGRIALTSAFSINYLDYTNRFHFFLYSRETDRYLPGNADEENDETSALLAERLRAGTISEYAPKDGWDIFPAPCGTVLVRTMSYAGYYFGFWITAGDFADYVQAGTVSSKEYIAILDRDGNALTELPKNIEQQAGSGLFDGYVSQSIPFGILPFEIALYMPVSRIVNILLWAQILLLCLIIVGIILFACLFGLGYVKLQKTLRQFTAALKTDGAVQIPQINELQPVWQYFQSMNEQIQNLNLLLYEKQVERQQETINFLRLQIKPHFYMNCLSLAYTMVEQGAYPDALNMMRYTIEYFRYLLSGDMQCEKIADELVHVRNYLEILRIRYRQVFDFQIETDPDADNCLIPPLIILSFVENAVKHTLGLNRHIDITVTAMRERDESERDIVNVYIMDTGDGFSEQALEKLQSEAFTHDETVGDGSIGILNSVKRLKYHYKDSFNLTFENSPQGGAVVALSIPAREKGADDT